MNRVSLIGRLTKDPEIRTNEAGTSRCTFDIAINRPGAKEGTQDVDFINCVAWNKQGENLAKYQGKGCLIGVEGEIRKDAFTDNEGNLKYYMYVYANRIEYLSSTKAAEEEPIEETNSVDELELTDEDLPF